MKLKQWIQVILVTSSAVALIGCHSQHKKVGSTDVNNANAAYNGDGGAQAFGTNEGSSFGDQAGGGRRSLAANNKHIYYFDFDSNVVHDQDKPAIVSSADYLMSHPRSKVVIMLEGHTDPRGSREYNVGLGERRAKAIARILTEKGVNPAQVRIVSYGAEKLASSGHNETDYQRDRRGVLVYLQR
jgi:peptidoglycan-associated lipoprotein